MIKSRVADVAPERDGKLAELDALLQESNHLLREVNEDISRDSECLKEQANDLIAVNNSSLARKRDGKLLELDAVLQGSNCLLVMGANESISRDSELLNEVKNLTAMNLSKDIDIAILQDEVEERDGKVAELEKLVQSLTGKNECLERQVSELEAIGEDEEANVALLEYEGEERDGKLAELELLFRNEIKESQEETVKNGVLEEQLKCSLKRIKELKDVITTSQETSEKSASQIKSLKNQVEKLILRKEEAQCVGRRGNNKKLAPHVFAQTIVDQENELERFRRKEKESRKALAEMTKALIAVEAHRKELAQKKSPKSHARS